MANRLLDVAAVKIDLFFKASSLMTERSHMRLFAEKDSSDDLLDFLKEHNYDIGVLQLDDGSYTYVVSAEMEQNLGGTMVEYMHRFEAAQTIRTDSPIAEIINKFATFRYLFVFGNDMLEGLITYSDLNKPPIYAFCYIVISEFEKLLRQIVESKYEEKEWLRKLSDRNQRELGSVYIFEKTKGVEISLLECTTLAQLADILKSDAEWCISAGYAGKADFSSKMSVIMNWRNAVMHNRTLILGPDGGKDLYTFLDDLGEQMENLQRLIKHQEAKS